MLPLALLVLLPFAPNADDRAEAPDPVVVRLRQRAIVTTRLVTVADVADLSGGPPPLRAQIGRLDLGVLPVTQPRQVASAPEGLTISRRQVSFRLQLAGIPASLFRIDGADSSQAIARFRRVTAEEVEAAARRALLATLPWSADEAQIDLVQPIAVALPSVAGDEQLIIKALLHEGQRLPGRVQMDVQLFVQGTKRLSLAVYFHVRPYVEVVVCRRRIDKGQELNASNAYIEKRPVDSSSPLASGPDVLQGKKTRTRRPILPGQVVLASDVERIDRQPEAVLVKSQQAVKIRVNVGNLQVTATGLALQDGKLGQVIRVQNSESKKVLPGRVLGPGLVEID